MQPWSEKKTRSKNSCTTLAEHFVVQRKGIHPWKAHLRFSYGNSKTQTILSSPYGDHPNRQALTTSNEQPKNCWSIGTMGNRVKWVWHSVSRTAIKGQDDADFIAKFTNGEDKGAEECLQWSIHIDGSSNRQADEVGVVLLSPEGEKIESMVHLNFPITNNEVEYEALVAGLDLANAAVALSVVLYCNS